MISFITVNLLLNTNNCAESTYRIGFRSTRRPFTREKQGLQIDFAIGDEIPSSSHLQWVDSIDQWSNACFMNLWDKANRVRAFSIAYIREQGERCDESSIGSRTP